MLAFKLEFPLGVYHALLEGRDEVEWPPSPVRLVGALLAAAHSDQHDSVDVDRGLLQLLCEAPVPPLLVAPPDRRDDIAADIESTGSVVAFRGASRWVPRNVELSEMKSEGATPFKPQVKLSEANKSGMVVADYELGFVWPTVSLGPDQQARLIDLAADIPWLGTSRSPVIANVLTDNAASEFMAAAISRGHLWRPLAWGDQFVGRTVRVPTPTTLAEFDVAHDRRSTDGNAPIKAGLLSPPEAGAWINYAQFSPLSELAERPVDSPWDSTPVTVVIDSELGYAPTLAEGYRAARALRRALLSTFGSPGESNEAPPLLWSRDNEPHVAVLPLADVGFQWSDGRIAGFAIWLPSEGVTDLAEQRALITQAVHKFMPGGDDSGDHRKAVAVPGRGPMYMREFSPGRDDSRALSPARHSMASRFWLSANPVVHSRYRTSSGPRGIQRQIESDFADAGVSTPEYVESRTRPYAWGAATGIGDVRDLPEEWKSTISGPRSHLAFRFSRPVRGPIALGRGRFFGQGICVPVPEGVWRSAVGDELDEAAQAEAGS